MAAVPGATPGTQAASGTQSAAAARAIARECASCGESAPELFFVQRGVPAHSCLLMPDRASARAFPRGDIELVFCPACGFIGNRAFDPGLNRYGADYEETQAHSPRFRAFLAALCADQVRRFGLGPGRTALEIGCGKGEFLEGLVALSGCEGIGLDPAYRPERSPQAARSIRFIRDLYGPAYAHLAADYVCCRHTLEHIAPVREFMELVRSAIGPRPSGVFFELPATERVLAEGAFWDVYYEHCSYFTAGSLARLFRACAFDVERLATAYDEQYLLLEGHASAAPTALRLAAEHDLEHIAREVERFAGRASARIAQLAEDFLGWRAQGRSVALWGSGSKCVSLLSALEPGPELCAIVDVNPHRHGRFLAGSGHQIESPAVLASRQPDVVLVMNPIYVAEIRADLAAQGLAPRIEALS